MAELKKVAVVTGGSRGIGLAIMRAFIDAGYEAWSLSRTNPVLAGACWRHTDLSLHGSVERALADPDLTRIDCIVHNAGVTSGPVKDVNYDPLEALWRHGSARLEKAKGSFIAISSAAVLADQGPYAESKRAVEAWVRNLAPHVAGTGIRVNCIRPGHVAGTGTWPIERSPWKEQVPMRRFGRPEEVAEAVLFIARHPWIAGAILPVDGGMTSYAEREHP